MTDRAEIPIDRLLAHEEFVRGLARSLLGDGAGAEDATQETWLAALRSPPRRLERAQGWLATVVRNIARQQRRAELRCRRRERESPSAARVPAPEEILEREATRYRLVNAVAGLPPDYRTAILLRYFEDLPPRRMAQHLEVPVETVKTRRDGFGVSSYRGRRNFRRAVCTFARVAQPSR